MRVPAVLLLVLVIRVRCEGEEITTVSQRTNQTSAVSDRETETTTGHVPVKTRETFNTTSSTESHSPTASAGNTTTKNSNNSDQPKVHNGSTCVQQGSDTGIILDTKTILTFLAGAASTAVIVCVALCFVGMCLRCGTVKAVDGNANKADVQLEAVKIQHNPAGPDQEEEDEHTPLRGRHAAAAAADTNTAALSGEVEAGDTAGEDRASGEEEQKDVDYACIDYSLLRGRAAEAQKTQSEGETEYAEIQIQKQCEEEGAEDLQDEEQVVGGEEEIQV